MGLWEDDRSGCEGTEVKRQTDRLTASRRSETEEEFREIKT